MTKRIYLIDCPGIVYDVGETETDKVLKGVVRAERIPMPETFIQAILDKVQKNASVEEGRESIELIAAHGMLSETSFVLGFPEETAEELNATLTAAFRWAGRARIQATLSTAVLRYYPGASLFEEDADSEDVEAALAAAVRLPRRLRKRRRPLFIDDEAADSDE